MSDTTYKKITVMLSRYSDPFGKFMQLRSKKKGYSHASISVDENEEIFYSFNLKGFAVERPDVIAKKSKYFVPGRAFIRMMVPPEVYERTKNFIMSFEKKKPELSYTGFGLFLALCKIPHEFRKRYFCSQFVAKALGKGGAVCLLKDPSLYLPENFPDELVPLFSPIRISYSPT